MQWTTILILSNSLKSTLHWNFGAFTDCFVFIWKMIDIAQFLLIHSHWNAFASLPIVFYFCDIRIVFICLSFQDRSAAWALNRIRLFSSENVGVWTGKKMSCIFSLKTEQNEKVMNGAVCLYRALISKNQNITEEFLIFNYI